MLLGVGVESKPRAYLMEGPLPIVHMIIRSVKLWMGLYLLYMITRSVKHITKKMEYM
jgi:hypothetical protein